MNGKWLGMAIVMAGASAGCGEGRLIFNVDVFSFFQGSVKDTLTYLTPPLPGTYNAPDQGAKKIDLVPGLGSSAIDTVKVTGSANVINQSGGPGTLRFQVYLAADSAGTYTAGKDSLFSPTPSAIVAPGSNTVMMPLNISNLSPSGNALFSNSTVWIRLSATVTSSGVMQGKVALSGLNLRVVVQDKLF